MLLVGVGIAAAAIARSAAAAGWSIQRAPQPAHAYNTDLLGVSCTSTDDCTAVGQWDRAASLDPIPLVEHWNGTRWSIERTPIATAPGWSAWLSGVSCTSRRACIAVGSSYTNSAGMAPLAERWNGTAWSVERTPHPFGTWQFDGVSCATNSDCIAVGSGEESFAQRWDGKRWTLENIHFGDPQGRVNALAGVSCARGGTCAAVGWDDIGLCADQYYSDYQVPVLGLRLSGRWSLKRRPDVSCSSRDDSRGGDILNAVSCTSAAACTAVGTGVYRWNGHRWTTQRVPIGDPLSGVSCTSETACTAVSSVASEIYTWSGRAWSIVPTAESAQVTFPGLRSVSCTAPKACVAVGDYEDLREADSLLIEATGR